MSISSFVTGDGCRLAYETAGEGLPVLWQHGLGADRKQPAEVFPSIAGVRRITLECRGHGESSLCDPQRLSIAGFAEDALALLDHLHVAKAVVGGISLGAAIALRLAAFHPDRISGLILARPAWVNGPSLETMAPYLEVATLLQDFGAEQGAQRFRQSPLLRSVEAVSPDNAQSLESFFTRPDPNSTILLLSKIAQDSPDIGGAFDRVVAPTLIVANHQDFVHPIAYARELQAALPNAELELITSKTIDRQAYVTEFKAALSAFLGKLGAAS
jgi:pimeloyl-ACP methyl ester carboxylesterase